jgi:L-2-hydroxyglutarate oxidase LhgO
MAEIDVAVIGAGVTGLAAALSMAEDGRSVCVIERHPRPGLDTSTHNSGVIHGGIYYPAGTLKSRLCIEGRPLLYEFCNRHRVPFERCGKLIVATAKSEIPRLEALYKRGGDNGVDGLLLVDRAFITKREPNIRAEAAIFSPETGIVEAEALDKARLRAGEDAGVIFLPATKLVGADANPGGVALRTDQETILAGMIVNAAGLYADDVSRMVGGEPFTIYPVRGEYAELVPSKRSLVNALVYPLPHAAGHGGKTTTRTIACPLRNSLTPSGNCCRWSPSATCACRAAGSAPSCIRRPSRLRISSSGAIAETSASSMRPASNHPA